MTIKVGINGFGRMGRLSFRAAFDWADVEFVRINDPAGDAASLAHLITFDSVHGRWHHEASAEGDQMVIGKHRILWDDGGGCDVPALAQILGKRGPDKGIEIEIRKGEGHKSVHHAEPVPASTFRPHGR